MKNLFSLDLQSNPVKQSKIKRTFDKLNKSSSIVYNINNNKVGMNEFKYIVSVMNDEMVINQEESIRISKAEDKTIMSVSFDGETKLVIITNDKNLDFLSLVKKYPNFGIAVLDLTETLVDSTNSVNIEYKSKIIREISQKFNSSYQSFEIYAKNYFRHDKYSNGYSLEAALHVQQGLKWTNAELELFRKEAKVFAGDVVPTASNMDVIIGHIASYLGAIITTGELKFLKEKIESLYLNTEGRFPNLKDLVFEIEQSHIKNKEIIITKLKDWEDIGSQSLEDKNTFVEVEEDKNPIFLKKFHEKYNDFINKTQNGETSNSSYFVSEFLWNQASLVEGGINLLFNELKKINEDKKFKVIELGPNKLGIPQIYICYNFDQQLKELDFSIFAKKEV